ncbi:MAG: hypothetical protein ACOC4R_00180 [Bacteroidota bacterium]
MFISKRWLAETINLQDDYISNYILKHDKYFLFEDEPTETAKAF